MRANVISHFIKEEWYSQRRMLRWYFLITILLELFVILFSWQEWGLHAMKESGFSSKDGSLISFAFLFMPYAIYWMLLSNKLDHEQRSGFYNFTHILPITVKEMVTAKYISTFLMNALLGAWLCILWRVYEMTLQQPASLTVWTALCVVVFFYTFSVLAILLGMFFKWKSGNLGFIFLIALLLGSQFDVAGQFADQTIDWMDRFPLLLWATACLLTVTTWILCWRWSIKAYQK